MDYGILGEKILTNSISLYVFFVTARRRDHGITSTRHVGKSPAVETRENVR